MANIRTLDQFQNALDKEMGWRVKEIGVFNVAARENSPNNKSFIRAGVALTYAHWEGFIKSSSEIYLEYINFKCLKYKDLKTCFAIFGLKSKLNSLRESKIIASNVDVFDFIVGEVNNVAKINFASAINTQSNLSSKVFCNIANSLGIDTSSYSTRFNLIDKKLVETRNSIAHGEYISLNGNEFSILVSEILQLMRHYKIDLENSASLELYKR